MQLRVAGSHVGAVERVAEQPQEERERLRSRGSTCEGARHLPEKKTSIKAVRGAVVGLSGVTARAKDFWGGELPTGDPIGKTKVFMAAIVTHHENIRRGGLDRTSELLRGVGRVDRGGKREDRNARCL